MGDYLEITTGPNDALKPCYILRNNAFNFSVKGANALISLIDYNYNAHSVWICIGENNDTCSIRVNNHDHRVSTPQILSNDEYRHFWIFYNNKCVMLGQGDNAQPIIQCKINPDHVFETVCFGTNCHYQTTLSWKIIVPPMLKLRPMMKPLNCGQLEWVPATSSQIPPEAIIGGFENEPLYIIRAPHQGSLTPGKFALSQSHGYISWSHLSHEKTEFEVLCGYNYKWVETDINHIPVEALVGGHTEYYHEKLFVGRAKHNEHIIPGKVQAVTWNVCFFAFEGRELSVDAFEVLVQCDRDPRLAFKYLNNTDDR